MNREEIQEKYTWDLTKIFKNIDEFNQNYQATKKEINNYQKHEKTMLENATNFYNAINDYYKISRKLDKLYTYTSLIFDEDISNNTSQSLKIKMTNLYDKWTKNNYFLSTNILKKDYSELEKYYKEEPKLLEYEKVLKDEFRYKEHTLSETEEKLLSNINKLFNNNHQTYSLLKDSDLTFDNIIDEEEKSVELTNSNYSIYIESCNRKVRKSAFQSLYKTYHQFSNTFASTLSGFINEITTYTKVKKYNSAIEASLYKDEISLEIYNNLIDTVNNNLNILFKYYDLKKELLELKELHLYDIYAPIVSEFTKEYPFEEGKKLVINALKVLGKDYIEILEEGINNRWIDIYPTNSKRTGAYSGGAYDTYPYVLLNYQNKYNDVSTLAHELGHSMHSYYTRKENPYQYGEYSIFVAEVASTVNELLLSKYLLKNSTDNKEKLFILDNLMTLFKSTIYRQTMFAEFEKDIYYESEQGTPITAEYLSNTYYNLNKKYFGNTVIVDEEIKYEWTRIPHFYYNFYVYKYATGLSAACQIVDNILNNKENAITNYKKFLSCGTTKTPIESLKIAGVDLTKKEVIESAITMFNNTIQEFKEIYTKEYK